MLLFALKPSLSWTIQSCFSSGITVSIYDSRRQPHQIPDLDLPSVRGEFVFLSMMCAIGLNGLLWIFALVRFRTPTEMLDPEKCFSCGHPLPNGERCVECGVLQAGGITAMRRGWIRASGLVVGLFVANTTLLICLRTLPLECVVESRPGSTTFCTPAVRGGRFAYAFALRGVCKGSLWSPEQLLGTDWYAVLAGATETSGKWQWKIYRARCVGQHGELVPTLTQLSSALGATLSKDQLDALDESVVRAMGWQNSFGFTWLSWPQPTPRAALILVAIWLVSGLVVVLAWTGIFRSTLASLTLLPESLSSS